MQVGAGSAQLRGMMSTRRQEDGRTEGENKPALEEVCLAMRFPPGALYGGRVGVKEAGSGRGKWSLGEERSRREERGRLLWRRRAARWEPRTNGRDKATKETAVKAALLNSSNSLSSPGRKGTENKQGHCHAQLIMQAGHTQWSALCTTTWCEWNTWQGDKLHSFAVS